jgi:hypothetical protein
MISEQEICDILLNLDTNKASGRDGISPKMLKSTAKTLCTPLCIIFNRSLQEGVFPDVWKTANVIPIFKKGEADTPSNYRPISLLSCLGKVLERIIYKHIYNYLQFNELIFKNQSGFRSKHSAVYQLIEIYHQICQTLDSNHYMGMIFCDISKAFDRVWHKGLLYKLKQCGIDGKILLWIENYLCSRKQVVTIGSSISKENVINAGVPQGSILGPLFFLIYVNDIANNLLSVTRLFADDTSLAQTTSNIDDLEGLLNFDLRMISAWAKQWLVKFNPDKTEVLFFSCNKTSRNPVLIFDDDHLNFVSSHKHLGVTLSNDGKWHAHIDNIMHSASKVLGLMKAIKFKLNRNTLNQIYISFLRPVLEYASVVWDSCNEYEKAQLERLQYEAARIVTGLTRCVSIINLSKEIGWVPLSSRREMQKLIIMYKLKNGMIPGAFSDIFPNIVGDVNPYNLRNSDNFNTLSRRTALFSNSFVISATNLWNNLPPDIKESETLDIFKHKLKSILYSQPEVPEYFKHGNRTLSVYHARIRNNCSNLNGDLYMNHLTDNNTCLCNNDIENAEHFFFRCRQYQTQRIKMFHATRQFHPLNIQTLLQGRTNLSLEQNTLIFKAVQQYIKDTKRFNIN